MVRTDPRLPRPGPPRVPSDGGAELIAGGAGATVLSAGGWRAARRMAVALLLAYLAATAAVPIALRAATMRASGTEMTADRAVFAAVNAATLTGFGHTMGVREMSADRSSGPVILLMMTFAGSIFTLAAGGLAATRVAGLAFAPRQILSAATTAVLLAALAGAAALASGGHNVFEAIFQAASAFGNSGLWIGELPSPGAPSTFLILLPLAVLGGLGLPVLMELTDRLFGGPALSRHARVVLALAAVAYLAAAGALVLGQIPAAAGHGWPAWRATLASCSAAAVNTRSAGLPMQSPAAFTAAGQWILIALMLIGAAPAGTASGVKTTTLWQLGRGIGQVLSGRLPGRIVGIAAVWAAAYLLVLFAGLLVMVTCEPQMPGDRMLFLVASALGNVGLSHDPVAITGPGLFVLAGLMLFGRLAPLAVLWWAAETCSGPDVAVG